ncbi:MAG: hypothetical protein AMXMBFR64_04470 [Myxococcales bacterium]
MSNRIEDGESSHGPDDDARDDAPAAPDLATVLVVDDDVAMRLLLVEQLIDHHYVLSARDGNEALRLLAEHQVAVVLSDQRMPEMSGTELLSAAVRIQPDAARILLTAYGDIQTVVQAVNEGHIFYYLTKPWQAFELQGIVARGVEHNRLLRERRRLIDELRQSNLELERRVRERTRELLERTRQLEEAYKVISELAALDPLTSVANRRTFMTALKREHERSERSLAPLTLIMLDLDYFKSINDTYGHGVGDLVLQETARHLKEVARPYDVVARIGGEEFVVLLPSTGLDQGTRVAERLRAQLAGMSVEGMPDVVTASFGVACLQPGEDTLALMRRVDAALYRAKDGGRNRVVTDG